MMAGEYMGYSNRQIEREVFAVVGETCPHVDSALSVAADAIKIQTSLLRDALREYVSRALEAEHSLFDANERIKFLEEHVTDLKHELDNLR